MKNPDPLSPPAKPTVQVIERMFTLLEILAGREEAVSLKEISEKSVYGTPHSQRPGDRPFC